MTIFVLSYSLFKAEESRMRVARFAGINPDSVAAANVIASDAAMIATGV